MKQRTIHRLGQVPPAIVVVVLALTIGVIATTPLAFAKYFTEGIVTLGARVARFSFVSDTQACGGLGGRQDIIALAAVSQEFTLPLFDKEYYGRAPNGSVKTVVSSLGDAVVAPGINGITDANYEDNPDYAQNLPATNGNLFAPDDSRIVVKFVNESEVAVRYKLEYDRYSVVNTLGGNPTIGVWNIRMWDKTSTGAIGTSLYSLRPYQDSFPVSGDVTVRDWTILTPGGEDELVMSFSWEFCQGSYPNGDTEYVDGWDNVDTALGIAAAKGNIYFEPKFKVTVEQID